jgi:hypothetical protein
MVRERDPLDELRPTVSKGLLSGLLILILGGGAAFLLFAGRGTTFLGDEWLFIVERRSGGLDSLLMPHNGNLVLLHAGMYRVLFGVVGLEAYWPYRAIAVAVTTAAAGLTFAYARPRLGAIPALALSGLLVVLGRAAPDVWHPLFIQFTAAGAATVGAFLAIDRGSPRWDAAAIGLAGLALAVSSAGIAAVAAVGIDLLARPGRRRMLVLLAVPVILFGAWALLFGEAPGGFSLILAPWWALRLGASAAGALIGQGPGWGWVPLVAILALASTRVVRDRALGPRTAAIAAAVLTYFGITAAARAQIGSPYNPRYVYLGALLLLLLAVESRRGTRPRRQWGWVAAAVLAVSLAGNVRWALRDGGGYRVTSSIAAAEMAAMDLAGPALPATFRPDSVAPRLDAFTGLTAAEYRDAVGDLGAPAPPSALSAPNLEARRAADTVLASAVRVTVGPPAETGSGFVRIAREIAGVVRGRGSCADFVSQGPDGALELVLAPGEELSLAATGPVGVFLSRYGPPPGSLVRILGPGRIVRAAFPVETSSARSWLVRLTVPWGGVRACVEHA